MAPRRSQRAAAAAQQRSVAEHVRDRQRAVAEREASRLARPEVRPAKKLGHADRKKSAVTSTPFGVLPKQQQRVLLEGGEKKENWCGPFAVAREMITMREDARRKREAEQDEDGAAAAPHPLDQAMEELHAERKRKAHPSLQWKGKPPENVSGSESLYAKRQKRVDTLTSARKVPSLFDICVNFLVQNWECVEGLGDVDSSIRTKIARELVASGKMTPESFQALAEVGCETLEIPDCSEIPQNLMGRTLSKLLPAGLRYLLLDQAGRCLGPKVIDAIVSHADSSSLFALSFGGAYLLTDADASRLLKAVSKTVTSLGFSACPLLGSSFCKSLGESYTASGGLVELALEDIPFSKEHLDVLSTSTALRNLKSVSLRRLEALSDEHLAKILEVAGDRLEGLDLTGSYNLTDATLASIRQFNPCLQGLSLSGLKQLTSEGLEALFTFVQGMSEPPMLRTLDLGQCDYETVTDQVVTLAAQASTKKQMDVGDQASMFGGLVKLDLQGSRLVTDDSMEALASSCTSTLRTLSVSFCPGVTDKGLGYVIEQMGMQLKTIEVWGCAQLTDELFLGHSRAADPSLEVTGAWMKKHSDSTVP